MKVIRALAVLLASVLVVPPDAATSAPAPRATPQLVGVRASAHPGFDRVVFEFEDGLPASITTTYVDRLIADGSGLPVRIAGQAVLQVTFHGTATNGPTPAPRRRAFALPNVLTAVRSGLFEGVTTYGIGVAQKSAFQVRKQPAKGRVVIDIRATFPTALHAVYFFDEEAFLANEEPFFVPRQRLVPAGSPGRGVLDSLFAGPLPREKANGLRLLRSRARNFADLTIQDHIARVRLVGGCSSGGSTVTVAGEIMPSLRQFNSVDWVKILGPAGHTADPTGPSDSIPDCLNP